MEIDFLPEDCRIHIFRELLRWDARFLISLRIVSETWNRLLRSPYVFRGGSLYLVEHHEYPFWGVGKRGPDFPTFPTHRSCVNPAPASWCKDYAEARRTGVVRRVSDVIWVEHGAKVPGHATGFCAVCGEPLAKRLEVKNFCDLGKQDPSVLDPAAPPLQQAEDTPGPGCHV